MANQYMQEEDDAILKTYKPLSGCIGPWRRRIPL